jgi:uncharacterized protein (TIGR03435 family)
VVAIKPVPQPTANSTGSGFNVDGARLDIRGYTLLAIVRRAFQVELPQIDAPDFARSELFEIQATLPTGATPEQVPEMLQNMLAERFKLAYHRETRDYLVTVLSVGKSGMKLARLPDGTRAPTASNRLPDGTLRITQTSNVSAFFPLINSFDGLRIVDETGLDGIYAWVRDVPPTTPEMNYRDAEQDSIKAMLEAAGLKLETRKVPKETIVVDHLEKKPTEN